MRPRDPAEHERASTPLELLFDLTFVVAIAQVAAQLHHLWAEDHIGTAVQGYLTVFFAIWWAWMNFTWFASSYDTDDVPYRITTMVQMAGVLVLAAGVPQAVEGDFLIITVGYLVMRLAMVAQWLRAAAADPVHRATARRYAVGIAVVQLGWVARLLLPDSLLIPGFLLLVVAELAVPAWAERRGVTPYHPQHIAERYRLLTIIVLGESILAATVAVQEGIGEDTHLPGLIGLAAAGLVIVFCLWWYYCERPMHDRLGSLASSLRWGYGHYLIFASLAAVGAGLSVAVDHDMHVPSIHIGATTAALATTIPVAVCLLTMAVLHIGPAARTGLAAAPVVGAGLVIGCSFTPVPVHLTAVVLVGVLVIGLLAARREQAAPVAT